MTIQVANLEKLLAWLNTSPFNFTVSSMSGGYAHIKFLVPCDKDIPFPSDGAIADFIERYGWKRVICNNSPHWEQNYDGTT